MEEVEENKEPTEIYNLMSENSKASTDQTRVGSRFEEHVLKFDQTY